MRRYNSIDRIIMAIDAARHNVAPDPLAANCPYPGEKTKEPTLSDTQRKTAIGLMRVNHAGEIAAQALYKAQAVTARERSICIAMQQAAKEERMHLYWCDRRLRELQSMPSRLGPVWFVGAFSIGFLAGCIGDKWSLGFLAETERQVVRHLQGHIVRLSVIDPRSSAILEQMQRDEAAHADHAVAAGAPELPVPVRALMWCCSRVMTTVAYLV